MHTPTIELSAKHDRRSSGEEPGYFVSGAGSQDATQLQRAGKKAVLKRNFGFMSILAFSCLVVSTWLGAFVLLGLTLPNGGPAGTIYSFIIVWIGNLATFASLAELASMAPTSGGQYHWVSILAPRSQQKIWSYVTGWLTVAGWQASLASGAYVCGLLFQGFIELLDANYSPQLWHVTLLLFGSIAVCTFVCTVLGTSLPIIESILMVLYVCGFIGIIVPLVYLAPHQDASFVFTTFVNNGGWSTQGVSFFVGISGMAFGFLGADSVYHMSEEVKNAAIVVPQSMLVAIVFNGVVGLAMFIAVLFAIEDLDTLLTAPTYVYPFIDILVQATNSIAGTAVILVLIIIIDLALVIGVVASASRMLWAFARDKGVPGWRWVMQVDPKTTIPLRSILITVIVSVLIGLISIGSPVAFNDVVSLTVNGLYASYFVACILLLWRRLKGDIKDPSTIPPPGTNSPGNLGGGTSPGNLSGTGTDAPTTTHNANGTFAPTKELHTSKPPIPIPISAAGGVEVTNIPGNETQLTWGPWRIREPWGTIVNAFACCYLSVVFVFTFFPPATPVTPNTMNYSSLVMGFVAILSAVYYAVWGHRTYRGPVVEVE